jgi:hypothetical protein
MRKVKVMFRKMAIALVAASVFTAPVLAQNDTLTGGSGTKSSQVTTPPAGDSAAEKAGKPEKAEKSAEAVEKSMKKVTRHHRVARHHRHGTKAAKYVKSRTAAVYAKRPGVRTAKYAKQESRRISLGRTTGRQALGSEMVKSEKRYIGHGRTTPKRAYGRVSKPMRSKTKTKPSID